MLSGINPGLVDFNPGVLEIKPNWIEVNPSLAEVVPNSVEVGPNVNEHAQALVEIRATSDEIRPVLVRVTPCWSISTRIWPQSGDLPPKSLQSCRRPAAPSDAGGALTYNCACAAGDAVEATSGRTCAATATSPPSVATVGHPRTSRTGAAAPACSARKSPRASGAEITAKSSFRGRSVPQPA